MTRWIEPVSVEVPAALHDAIGGHPLVAVTLARRGILTPSAARAFLDAADYQPARPTDLPDLSCAIEELQRSIGQGERIAVWGDFDADGQTATALLLETLRALKADVVFYVPSRQEGHGLHEQKLERLIAGGAHLILTCDTGITAHEAIARANALGARVIVTDHHTPSDYLPAALAVVNPHRLPSGHPLASLSGVGVAYQVARGLDPTLAEGTLDLVALGTIADVATLTADNRFLVQRGLDALRTTDRLGLEAVYQIADLQPNGITEEHVGFVLAPRLNALGRLADATSGVELLVTTDRTRARMLATEVEGLNARRQWLTKQVMDAALAQIERDPSLLDDYQALVLSHASWPGGVVGIVAGRLAERFGKPAVLITAPEGKLARGSGRSVPGVDLIAVLTDCRALLETFGGHAGAAGFSIRPERIPELRAALSRAVAAQSEGFLEPVLAIDAYVILPDLTLDLVGEINRLAPFGPGNPPLVLAIRDLRIVGDATIGRTGEHRRITVEDTQERTQTIFWWQGAEWPLPRGRFDLALTIRASDYRGLPEVQVEWIGAREQEPVAVEVETGPVIDVTDYRTVSSPETLLQNLLHEGDTLVWAEGNGPPGVETHSRTGLMPHATLVIWTLPPGPRELRAALEQVRPMQVILFGHDPGLDDAPPFLNRLAGLVKFSFQAKEGQVDLDAAAAAMAHRVGTVQTGLKWLAASGRLTIVQEADDHWQLSPGSGHSDPEAAARLRGRLEALLAETAAYRSYVRNAPVAALF